MFIGETPSAVLVKKNFGDAITFWGEGVDTLKILPKGKAEDVKPNIEALAPGGGFVFSTAHNIPPEVSPENIQSMLDRLYPR